MPDKQEDLLIFPEIKIDKQSLANLKMIRESMPTTRKNLEALKKVGVDVRVLEEHLDWAETVADTLEKGFS